jgi:hypothetical protein
LGVSTGAVVLELKTNGRRRIGRERRLEPDLVEIEDEVARVPVQVLER